MDWDDIPPAPWEADAGFAMHRAQIVPDDDDDDEDGNIEPPDEDDAGDYDDDDEDDDEGDTLWAFGRAPDRGR